MAKKLCNILIEQRFADKYRITVWCSEDDAEKIKAFEGVIRVTSIMSTCLYEVDIDHRYDVDSVIQDIQRFEWERYGSSFKNFKWTNLEILDLIIKSHSNSFLEDLKGFEKETAEIKLGWLEKEIQERFDMKYKNLKTMVYNDNPHYKSIRWWHKG